MQKILNIIILCIILLFFENFNIFANKIFIINDFDDGIVNKNSFGGIANYFQSGGADCEVEAECNPDNVYGRVGYSLKLTYNVSPIDSFSGYWSKLEGADLSEYKYISFWIKGAAGGEYLKVEFKNNSADSNQNKAWVYIDDYLEGGVTTEWKKVVIPLDAFLNINDWKDMKELIFTFENYQSRMNSRPLKGTVYIDNIILGTYFLGYVKIDSFNDKLGWMAIGGNIGTTTGDGSISYSFSSSIYNKFPNSLKLDYDVSVGNSWAALYGILGGGATGWTKLPHNFSNYDLLSFYIKAESTNKNPCGIKIELHDYINPQNQPFYKIEKDSSTNIKTNWQQFKISLSDFKNSTSTPLDKTCIQEIVFTFENSNVSNTIGTVYIDDVQFEVTGYTEDKTPPSTPYNLLCNGEKVKDQYIFKQNCELTVNADSSASDPTLECVRFEYSTDGGNTWSIIGIDYDTSDTTYSTIWDLLGLAETSDYQVRVVAQDVMGNETIMSPFLGTGISHTGFKKQRAGALIKSIIVPNNPFSPAEQTATFTYILSASADVYFKIFDINGNLVWEKDEGEKSGNIKYTIVWDGTDKDGNEVRNGLYFYKLCAKDKAGEKDEIIHIIGVVR